MLLNQPQKSSFCWRSLYASQCVFPGHYLCFRLNLRAVLLVGRHFFPLHSFALILSLHPPSTSFIVYTICVHVLWFNLLVHFQAHISPAQATARLFLFSLVLCLRRPKRLYTIYTIFCCMQMDCSAQVSISFSPCLVFHSFPANDSQPIFCPLSFVQFTLIRFSCLFGVYPFQFIRD